MLYYSTPHGNISNPKRNSCCWLNGWLKRSILIRGQPWVPRLGSGAKHYCNASMSNVGIVSSFQCDSIHCFHFNVHLPLLLYPCCSPAAPRAAPASRASSVLSPPAAAADASLSRQAAIDADDACQTVSTLTWWRRWIPALRQPSVWDVKTEPAPDMSGGHHRLDPAYCGGRSSGKTLQKIHRSGNMFCCYHRTVRNPSSLESIVFQGGRDFHVLITITSVVYNKQDIISASASSLLQAFNICRNFLDMDINRFQFFSSTVKMRYII